MSSVTLHAKEALYVKRVDLPRELRTALKEKYTFRFYEEKACKKCDVYDERMSSVPTHLEVCDSCPAYKGGAALATDVVVGNNKYLRMPIGDQRGLVKLLEHQGLSVRVKEHFPDKKFKRPIKFTGKFRGEYQKEAANAIIREKRGVIKAPPRSGKTVIFTAASCKIGKKTMILASQREWLIGFRETYIGSKTQPALTTCLPSQIGFARKYEDFLKHDICLVTVQTFYSEAGQKLLQKIKNMFHMVGVDEIHTGAAPKYAKVLSELNCERKIGLSGTPSRKDGRFVIMRNLMGPNIYEAKVARLRPRIRLVRTEYSQTSEGQVPWTRLVSGLERNPKRLKLIAQWAIRDAKNGHMVLIPFSQVAPIKALVMAINKLAGKRIAYPFWGGLTGKGKDGRSLRDIYIEAARNYRIKILVGNIKLLSTGTNIPRASAIYEVALSSNLENVEQRISRILTPYDGKPEPIARFFLDDMNVRRRCMQNEFWNGIKPLFKPIISDVDMETLKGYFSNKKEHERLTF